MSDTSIEEALRTLTENEATVLYWKYWGLDYEEIGKKLGYGVDWVTLQMSFVYRKLNFDKKIHWSKRAEILKKDVYSVFLKLIENDPKNLKNFPLPQTFPTEEIIEETKEEVVAEPLKEPEPDHEMMALVLYDEMREKEEKRDEIEKVAPSILIPTEVRQPITNWRRILIVGSLLGCIGCLVVGVGAYRLGRGDFVPVTESSVPTVQALSTTEPTLTTQSTDTETPLPTDTVAPTETPFPTDTPPPSDTPTPSPEPTAPPLFFDDFTNGKSDLWQSLYGNPLLVNSTLTFDAVTLMVLGEQWTDIEVSFDLSTIQCQQHVGSRGVTVGLRYQNPNNMVALRIANQDDCAATWFLVQDGKWNKLPNSSFPLPPKDNNGVRRFVLNVQGNTYNSPFGIPVVIENFPTGGVALFADPGVTIDNFKVSPFIP